MTLDLEQLAGLLIALGTLFTAFTVVRRGRPERESIVVTSSLDLVKATSDQIKEALAKVARVEATLTTVETDRAAITRALDRVTAERDTLLARIVGLELRIAKLIELLKQHGIDPES